MSDASKWLTGFDSVSRKWNEMQHFVFAIRLLMVDEIHYIADEDRGATLEATVVRMKSISAWKQQRVCDTIAHDIFALDILLKDRQNVPRTSRTKAPFASLEYRQRYRCLKVLSVPNRLGLIAWWCHGRLITCQMLDSGLVLRQAMYAPLGRNSAQFPLPSRFREAGRSSITNTSLTKVFSVMWPLSSLSRRKSKRGKCGRESIRKCQNKNPFALPGLNYQIPLLIKQHSNGRPVLVFCATRQVRACRVL